MTDLITEHEAAIFLGITKELLLSFVKTPVKGQKLPAHSKRGEILFSKAELQLWDEFLRQPWAAAGSARLPIPPIIREYLKVESRGRCVRCGNGHRLDNAHIDPWNSSYSHHPHNLIRLCTDCHIKYDDGIISRDEILELKQNGINEIKTSNLSSVSLSADEAQIPPLTGTFCGRRDELNTLKKYFQTDRCIMIQGVGGMGKTQLLVKFLQQYRHSVNWFNLEQYHSLQDFQIALSKIFYTSSLQELANLLDEAQVMLVLDGFEKLLTSEWDPSVTFLGQLVNMTKVAKIIVTSQVDFADAASGFVSLKLSDGLSAAESEQLLKAQIPSLITVDEFTNELINFAGGHPLTLVIIASLIKFLKKPRSVWEGLQETGSKMLQNPQRREQNKSSSLEICLTLSFELLGDSEQGLLKYLALFPAGHKTHFLARLSSGDDRVFKNKTTLKAGIAVLDQFNLATFSNDLLGFERAFMLGPIRRFVLDRTAEDQSERHRIRLMAFEALMMEAYVLFKEYMLSEDVEYGLMRYELDLQNYVYAFRSAVHVAYCEKCLQYAKRESYLRIISGLAGTLYKYLFTRGLFEYAFYFNKEGARAHVELGEYTAAIDDLIQLASLHYRRYDGSKAQGILATILEYEAKSGRRNPLVRLLEGELCRQMDPQRAIRLFEEGLKLNEPFLTGDDPDQASSNQAGLFMEMGHTYEVSLRDDRSALIYYQQAYVIQTAIKDFGNLYCTSHYLGNAYTGLQNYVKGLYYYQESLLGFMRLGQQQYISNSLSEIGKLRIDHPGLDYSFIDADVAAAGLEDIEREVKLSFGHGDPCDHHLTGKLPNEVVYKLWNIIKVISLSQHGDLLKPWAPNLATWLEDKLEANIQKMAPYPWIFLKIAELTVILRSERENENAMLLLKDFCYLNGSESEHDTMDPYEWLALWMRQYHFDDDSSRDKLFAEAEDV